jgi:hypothetical protein
LSQFFAALKMIKAMKKDDFRAVTKLYKELGNIIK